MSASNPRVFRVLGGLVAFEFMVLACNFIFVVLLYYAKHLELEAFQVGFMVHSVFMLK